MKRLFSIILLIAVGSSAFGAADLYYFGGSAFTAFADEPSEPAAPTDPGDPIAPVSNEIAAENVSLEYETISFNGGARKPSVTVKLGETALRAGIDFTVTYPEDCVNAGMKTVVVSGKGSCKGEARVSYTILPLDCANDPDVTVEVSDCRWNGLPQYPEITVKIGDYVIPKTDYAVSLSDNTEVSAETKKALCKLKFRGNCTGERTEEFSVLKKKAEGIQIDVAAKPGKTVSIDLTPIKPAGAIFGNPVFLTSDFSSDSQPRIAFNMLRFTLNPSQERIASIAIPMTNIVNSEDSWLEVYIEPVDKEVPNLVLKPLAKRYDGKPFTVSDLNDSGSYAYINGQVLEGEWSFITMSSSGLTMPCEKALLPVMFTPDDPQYSHTYGLISASILRKEANLFEVDCDTTKLDIGEILNITAKGIPDGFDGSVAVTAAEEDEFSILSEDETADGKKFEIRFPFEDAYHKLKITLGGSAFYAPKTIELKIKVGNPPAEPPADVPTTEQELAELIAKAEPDSTVKANRMTFVSADTLRAAAEKRLTIEVRANDVITYVLEPAKMKSFPSALNLTVNTAVIPKVLIEKLGDREICSFTSFASFAKDNGGVSIKAAICSEPNLPLVCFYLYSASGELEHIASLPRKGETARFELPGSGKFTITASSVSHIYRDLNNDCKINILDVAAALRLIIESTGTPSAEQLETLDFDGDRRLTVLDVRTLLEYAVNL